MGSEPPHKQDDNFVVFDMKRLSLCGTLFGFRRAERVRIYTKGNQLQSRL
jgi:hypothetical protein